VYNSYPASPVRLPRGSVYAYKVVWFNRNPAYADATYGAYDLVMQPLDEASPAFSNPSPAQGTTTTDPTPTISVNLSDVGTGGYTFGIESITMQVREQTPLYVDWQTVPHTYSGGVVSYTPTIALWNAEWSVRVTASDYAKNSAGTSWSFTVNAPPSPVSNMPPTADADGPYYVREGRAVQLDGTRSSDPERDTLTYNWTITSDPTGAASLTAADTATPTFHAPEDVDGEANVTVQLAVNDGHGGSNSATATVTVLEKFEIESEVTIDNIEAGGSVDVTVENTLVTGLKITVKNSVQNVRINVGQLAKTPSGVPVASGIPYRYICVATENLAQQDVKNVIIRFKVENSWITGENIDVGTIVLQRYNPATGSWENLPTERTGEGANFVYFEATSTSLSVFAVVGKTVPQPYVVAPPTWVIAIIAIVLVAVLIAVIWRYLSKSGPQSLKV
jgi:PGF-pre-PGF domain-containing protein